MHTNAPSFPINRQRGFLTHLTGSAQHFAKETARDPFITGFALFYVIAKFSVNAFYYHSGFIRAALSPLVGLLFLIAAVILTDAVALARDGGLVDCSRDGTGWKQKDRKVLALALFFWLMWVVFIIGSMQMRGELPGESISGLLPGWMLFNPLLADAAGWLSTALPFWSPEILHQILLNLTYWLLIPLLVLLSWGFKPRDWGFSLRGWVAAAPVLMIYALAFLFNGLNGAAWAKLGRAFLYPAMPEEFFQRGVMQRAFSGWMQPRRAILLTALMVGLMHIPTYVFRIYQGDVLGGTVGVLDVVTANLLYGWLFMRSGSVAASAAAHALSDVVVF